MQHRIFDTCVLVEHWNRSRGNCPLNKITTEDAINWATRLTTLYNSNAIVTPVFLEYIAGARNSTELYLAEAYLEHFDVLDKGDIHKEDWREAEQIARRIRLAGKRRHVVDCLIRAIAKRLKSEVVTFDRDFPR